MAFVERWVSSLVANFFPFSILHFTPLACIRTFSAKKRFRSTLSGDCSWANFVCHRSKLWTSFFWVFWVFRNIFWAILFPNSNGFCRKHHSLANPNGKIMVEWHTQYSDIDDRLSIGALARPRLASLRVTNWLIRSVKIGKKSQQWAFNSNWCTLYSYLFYHLVILQWGLMVS